MKGPFVVSEPGRFGIVSQPAGEQRVGAGTVRRAEASERVGLGATEGQGPDCEKSQRGEGQEQDAERST